LGRRLDTKSKKNGKKARGRGDTGHNPHPEQRLWPVLLAGWILSS
jgi:hypothetical protein